ncbi:thioredoxin family protein [Simplicispira psychrophila]|uniref:thioredoxin family protein n=1 Tax=Simplicispira psychrophila TaxID=80882 RepID=UPI000488472F|nr:thioredoxin family protein [Simplicispira psychrophila]
MPYTAQHLAQTPSRADIEHLPGTTLLEFGTPWCGHCQGAQPLIAQALQQHSDVAHVKVEDGKGQPLGRSYSVRLWPTLVVLQHGQEVARLVRPANAASITQALQSAAPATSRDA